MTARSAIVLWLHGGAGRGNDNEKQITGGNSAGAGVWAAPANQSRYPAFVVAPQCPEGETWTTGSTRVEPTPRLRQAVELLDELRKAYSIDPQRLYLAGQSMGGYAVWALLATYPDMFAAAIPICGGGDVSQARKMTQVSIWAFHGELDRSVSVERSREMVVAVKRLGGTVRYTEYKGADHVVWSLAFAEPALLPWVFAQRRDVPSRGAPRSRPGGGEGLAQDVEQAAGQGAAAVFGGHGAGRLDAALDRDAQG